MKPIRIAGALLVVAVSLAWAGDRPPYSHEEHFEHYEGTATCLECHEDAAETFFHSQHYQWQGFAPDIVNARGRKLGKMNTINDFCTNPAANWIGEVRSAEGRVVTQGCSKCHAGRGRLPSETLSREQLENIDCLICHASGYRRNLYRNPDGSLEWKPILWKNQYGLDSVAKRISLPERKMCLRCHAGSGGGPNYKRGDIEYRLADCDPEFDVHMASSGNDMQCVDCHAAEDHRIRGRGTDLSATDAPDRPLSCSSDGCHGESPHTAKVLNHHARRVNCTVCHIPAFARDDPTDMMRDWSRPVYLDEAEKYSPTLTMEKDVAPVYAWYNGKTREQFLGEPIRRMEGGAVGIMMPEGSRKDRAAKIYAFKLHRGTLPVWTEKSWLIPIAVEEFFADGNIDQAVRVSADLTYGVHDPAYEWVPTVRYMGLFHEVQPAGNALQCLDCHMAGGRMDWKALGYKEDPLETVLK